LLLFPLSVFEVVDFVFGRAYFIQPNGEA